MSKEGVNRTERQGKDDGGGYAPSSIPGAESVNSAGAGVADGVKGAGGYVGGMFGGGGKEEKK